jgi:hypothetical protein
MRALIWQRCADISSDYNNALKAFNLAEAGLKSSRIKFQYFLNKFTTGSESLENEDYIKDLSEAARDVLKFKTDRISAIYLYLINTAKIDRLLLRGYYQDLEAALPEDEDKLDQYHEYKKLSNQVTL